MRSRTLLAGVAVTAVTVSTLLANGPVTATAATARSTRSITQYDVLLEPGATKAAAVKAVRAAGGRVTGANSAVGLLRVTAPTHGFVLAVSRSAAVVGAARARVIGRAPGAAPVRNAVEQEGARAAATRTPATRTPATRTPASRATSARRSATADEPAPTTAGMDPLDDKLWGLKMVRSDLARTVQAGDKGVTVGVLDTGIDARNPDIAPNFDAKRSRNFVTDIPDIDGPCEFTGCKDPVGWDDDGHGTHVAGTIAAAANGFGVSGVAPNVTLVEIRGGQDSGFFFLDPVVNALTHGADVGLDVINMSFFVDPWLYNCTNNPADSPERQAEQRTIIATVNRALNYAHRKGVTLVAALGNDHDDLGHPRTDVTSPDFPDGTAYPRPIDNATCVDLPVEGPHVIGVSALGPSAEKADYSNYGVEQISVSAPGGWFRDGLGTPTYRTNGNLILSTYPVNSLQAAGSVDAAGNITPAGAAAGDIKSCPAGVSTFTECGYYHHLQGTSMASPHTTGVSALIVSQFGKRDRARGGLTLDPAKTERVLLRSAAEHACPPGGVRSYVPEGRSAEFTATCEGTVDVNGFYGRGIVDAYAAVTSRRD